MYLTPYINEKNMVEAFIKESRLSPIAINNEMRWLFIWGAEIMLSEDTVAGDNRRLDLIGTDDKGNVWLIEAKLGGNPELSPMVWSAQLLPYRSGLSVMHPDVISRRTQRFLSSAGQFSHLVEKEGCQHLLDAFLKWSRKQGKELSEGRRLYNQTISAISNQELIAALLADRYDEATWEQRPKDGRNYAYILVEGDAGNPSFRFRIDSSQEVKDTNTDYSAEAKTWSELARPPEQIKTSPEVIEEYLTNPSAQYFRRCIDNLQKLRWTGDYDSNSKAIAINMPTYHGADIRIHLGWIDFDAKVPITYRVGGALGLKFNIDFRLFKESSSLSIRDEGYKLARKLAKIAHYTGRRKGLPLRERDLDDAEKASWDWETQRWRNNVHRDYIGRPEEEEDFAAAWEFLYEIINPSGVTAIHRNVRQKKAKKSDDIPFTFWDVFDQS